MLALYPYPRLNRLLKPKDFQHVFKDPLKITTPCFVFFVRQNALSCARLGLVITKRRFKYAVVRNKIRRLIRESFRKCSPQLSNVDVIVLAKESVRAQTNANLLGELDHHWRKLILAHSPKHASLN